MTAGRCAGCGKTSVSCKTIRAHVVACPAYQALYRDPVTRDRCVDPETEYVRWRAAEGSSEARQEARADRLAARFADADRRRAEQVARWSPQPDILDD